MASIRIVLFKSKTLSNGKHPVMVRITHRRKVKYIGTGYNASEKEWDEKKSRFKKKSGAKGASYIKINNSLEIIESDYIGIVASLNAKEKPYSVQDILDRKNTNKDNVTTLFSYMQSVVDRLLEAGKEGNSNAYKNTLGVIKKYRKQKDLYLDQIDYKFLIDFEQYLLAKGDQTNGISFNMRTLRATFNRAIKEDLVSADLYPFKNYKIKRGKTQKRAIIKDDISKMKYLDLADQPGLDKARDYFLFSFYNRGISFRDMAQLKVKNIFGDHLYYSRQKVDQNYSIRLVDDAMQIVLKYNDLSDPDSYLFPIIKDPKGHINKQCRNGLRLTNKKLKIIGKMIGLSVPLTTYVSRHSWATAAKREGITTAIISEGLGHTTERTTQIYLDSFENSVLDDANDIITRL